MKITLQNIVNLRAHLSALDGVNIPTQSNGQTVLVHHPFIFKAGVRRKIVRNIRLVDGAYKEFNATRDGIIREFAEGGDTVPAEKIADFRKKEAELLAEEIELPLEPISETDLDLDTNQIKSLAACCILDLLGEPARPEKANPLTVLPDPAPATPEQK